MDTGCSQETYETDAKDNHVTFLLNYYFDIITLPRTTYYSSFNLGYGCKLIFEKIFKKRKKILFSNE